MHGDEINDSNLNGFYFYSSMGFVLLTQEGVRYDEAILSVCVK